MNSLEAERPGRLKNGRTAKLPLSVLIPCKNEQHNLTACLAAINEWAEEIIVVDSGSTDRTTEIAVEFGAHIVQFQYKGGWPKKRQWALDNLALANEWILLLDADEMLTTKLKEEIAQAIRSSEVDGYYLRYNIWFLNRELRFGFTKLWKLSLFRRGKGRFECKVTNQNTSMADMEVHEHVIVNGPVKRLKNPMIHRNVNSLSDYIMKHNEYSNWEAAVYAGVRSRRQAVRSVPGRASYRQMLKYLCMRLSISPFLFFLYAYFVRLGFLDGRQGFIYSCFQTVQLFHCQAKLCESRMKQL
jgi:glycosyltransferase involved in cell wall biosynthesis